MTNIFLFSKLLNINNIKSFNLFYMANLVQQGKQLYNIITPKRTGDIFSQLLYKLYPVKSQDPIEELCLKHNNNPEDKEQLLQIIKLLNYPCSQIAQLHMRANQLGTFDLSEQHRDKYLKSKQLNNNNKKISQNQQESDSPILKQFCPCCGYIVQECHINFFTPLKNVKNIGISTFLYFQTIINLTLLLLAMLVIGQLSSKIPLDQEEKRKYLLLYLTMKNPTITLANRSKTIFLTSNWVGFIIVFVWVLLYIFIKYKEGKLEFQIDNQSITASDFTLIFRDIPKQLIYSQMKQLDSKPKVPSLHEQIREYQKKVEKQLVKQNHEIDQKLKVEVYKIQQIIPFYLDESKRQNKQFLRRINKQYFKIKQKLIKMIKYRRTHDKFQQSDSKQRQNFRNKFVEQKRKRKQALKNQIYEKHVTEQNESGRMTVFVTFNSIHSKNFVEKFNAEQSYLSFFRLSRLEDDLKLKLKLPNGQEQIAQIQIAPEPEDIIWMNFGQRNKFIAQSIKTFVYAFLALCASCFIVYFCSAMKKSLCQKDEWKNKIGKWSISMVMSATNSIIREIMKRLTIKQRKETKTEEQKNLALKTIFITLINSIAMPIIVNELLAQKIQGKNGLQDDILGFAWSNALLTPFLKFIGSSCVFNVMWARYKNSPLQKLTLNQAKLNRLHQNPEFQIGYQYVHIISFYLFACFYASLNIKILYPAILGFVLMYYSQKFSLFNYYKRPTPGTIICNRTLFAFVVLGPALFSSANIIWSASSINPFNQNKLYDYSCFVLSLLILRIPYAKISEKISTQQIQTQALYEDKFPYLPANYTFSNPSASKIQINKQKDHRQLLCKEKKGEEEILVLSYYQVGKSPSKKMEEIKEIQKQMCFDIEKRKWNNQKFQQINSIKKKKI